MKKVEIFDSAAHVNYVMHGELGNITISRMDPKVEVENDRKEVIEQAKDSVDEEGVAYQRYLTYVLEEKNQKDFQLKLSDMLTQL
ncbi:hypothetical protein ACRS52_01690 [Bacillus cytotoxicus]|uniref:Uncharacterized protein n=1 Tax=Bacillus cytotoxicus TaxID=580165 RepID=A0AAX2CGG5_9BACI|nr:hypothetical protein JC775_08830 [Bacillus cytotoxicus]QTR81027.1 hypothetical protein JC773_14740 [Bacillus cytotoxicus]QTR85177.1 hypothetical protein JC777_18040 [Bacillus cytotoxicus]QTR89205.1 hypothetical protein JC774_16545 [Bacillus cytotoxicus]SCL91031.1 Uncharacterized protein BCB44BAC_01806 [Bacillus cytotoxicus]